MMYVGDYYIRYYVFYVLYTENETSTIFLVIMLNPTFIYYAVKEI